MDKIRKLNRVVAMKDFGRAVFGTLSMAVGMTLLGKVIYGRGVRANQAYLCHAFPEEYDAMTAKLERILEEGH
nr:hypothetical protein [uncultured Dysosmobacter sp.]